MKHDTLKEKLKLLKDTLRHCKPRILCYLTRAVFPRSLATYPCKTHHALVQKDKGNAHEGIY